MSYILDIATAVPRFSVSKEELVKFYSRALQSTGISSADKKLSVYSEKTKISNRYSCIPDFNGNEQELFTDGNYNQPAETRMAVYKEKILPLAAQAIDKILIQNHIKPNEITHLITVSCTGVFAPGFEFLVSEQFGLQHTEKSAINFLGCYAAIKALKQAYYIAQSDPHACVLIISAELCSLHFYPSVSDEDIVANLLFADGAAAVIVCGNENKHIKNKVALQIDAAGSACIPNTLDLMTWNISSSAFRMHLNKHVVKAIKDNIEPVINEFLGERTNKPDYWAIHPGGVRIVQAVQESLHLNEADVEDSLCILEQYGNMSSPTILFILNRILGKVKSDEQVEDKEIFACAFGPGLSIEMIRFTSADTSLTRELKNITENYAFQI